MHAEESGPAVQRAAQAIERYLAQHPAAADSEEGIAQWWLPAMGVDVPVQTVCKALELLVERGVVSRTLLPDRAIYRAAAKP